MQKILIIDDEPLIRHLLRQMLQTEGYEVEEAEDGCEGIQRYRAAPADLVITDVQMPRLNGLDMIKALHQEFPEVKVIVISSDGDKVCHGAQALGIQDIFQKPFEMNAMIAAVRSTMANGKLSDYP